VEILKNWISALKNVNSDEINKNLESILKAINIVLQCSIIIDDFDGIDIAESISK
jgi:hypothetical protein